MLPIVSVALVWKLLFSFQGPFNSTLAEVGIALQDRDRVRLARDVLSPLEGRMTVAGISIMHGPVDGYLAAAEAFLGDTERATVLADRAQAVAEAEGWRYYLDWLQGHRTRLGF